MPNAEHQMKKTIKEPDISAPQTYRPPVTTYAPQSALRTSHGMYWYAGKHRIAVAGENASLPAFGPPADRQSKGAFNDSVRCAKGSPLGITAAQTELGFLDDRLTVARSMAHKSSRKRRRDLAGPPPECREDRTARVLFDSSSIRGLHRGKPRATQQVGGEKERSTTL